MQFAISRYNQLQRTNRWAKDNLPELIPSIQGSADAFKSALAWGHTSGFCRVDEQTGEVVIEMEQDLYQRSLNHFGEDTADFHGAMLAMGQAFAKGLPTAWGSA